jgi:tetratricopeptide (TPR) repeat protein
MEIHIRLAGVELGPYTEEQVLQNISEGLLSLGDLAHVEGMQDWLPLGEVLNKLQSPAATQNVKLTPDKLVPPSEESKKPAPAATIPLPEDDLFSSTAPMPPTPPDVTHLSTKTASGSTSFMPGTIAPLPPPLPSMRKTSRVPLTRTPSQQRTSPMPTKAINRPTKVSSTSSASSSDTTLPLAEAPPISEEKKKGLSGLLKSLVAKTVPLRANPAPPPTPVAHSFPATIAITEPMPDRPSLKLPPGGIAPPSVVTGLTKKLEKPNRGGGKRPPPTEQELLEEVATTLIPPPANAKSVKKQPQAPTLEPADTPPIPIPPVPLDEPAPATPAPRLRLLPGVLAALGIAAAGLLYYVWSPYHAAASLGNALNSGNADDLTRAIDFPSVRESMKQQIKAQVAASGPASDALAVIDHSIDAYMTPEGISALVKNPDGAAAAGQAPIISSDVAAKMFVNFTSQPVRNEGLASPTDFVIDRESALVHLRYHGLGWKVEQVDLPPALLAPSAAGAESPILFPVVDTYLAHGDGLAKKGDLPGAIADYTKVLTVAPKSSVAYNSRANALMAKGDTDGAIKDYTQALTIDPQMASAFNGRGTAKVAKNDIDGAIDDFSQAVRLDPTLASAYDSRGNAHTGKNDLNAAIADYSQAIAIDPNLAGAYSDRGFARQANGNLDGAITDYNQALSLQPKNAVAYFNRGLAFQAQGQLDAAIADFNKALTFDPKLARAYFNRGVAHDAKHDVDAAMADYSQAIALNPNLALAYCNRGLAQLAKGDLDSAAADLTKALAIDPKISVAYYTRALIDTEKNDLDAAIADSSQALDLDPKNAQAFYTRGFAKLSKGNLDGALDDLRQFCTLAPRDHDADHARLYLWLIGKAQNSKTDGDQELSDALENSWNSAPDDIVTKTAAFLLGRMAETDYLAAADSPDAKTEPGQHCEADYFVGMKRLLAGDKKGAIASFHQSVATGQKDYCEYLLSQGEIKSLEPGGPVPAAPTAPPVAPVAKPVKTD